MKKILGFAGAIALLIIPTPSFSGDGEKEKIMSVTEQLLPYIGEQYKNLDKKEKKAYRQSILKYLGNVQKTGSTGVSESFYEDEDWGYSRPPRLARPMPPMPPIRPMPDPFAPPTPSNCRFGVWGQTPVVNRGNGFERITCGMLK